MHDFNMEGIGKIGGGEFNTITISGVGTCSNDIKAENIRVEGVFNCSGAVDAGALYCKGVADFKSNIRAKKINVEGVLNEKNGTKIEAEEIICDGVIKTGGEISADVLRADGCIEASEIVGDQIKINTHYLTSHFFKLFTRKHSDIGLIEATTINLSGVNADNVNGKDITIGPECNIDNIDCSGTLYIDKTSYVKNITGDYTRRD
jgi:cytoskeletal protein CcmA (bactofilin family)